MIFLEQVGAVVEQADLCEVRNSDELPADGVVLNERRQHIRQTANHGSQVFGITSENAGPHDIDGVNVAVCGGVTEIAEIARQDYGGIVTGSDGLHMDAGKLLKFCDESIVKGPIQSVLREHELDGRAF
jgi:hypothetical protein